MKRYLTGIDWVINSLDYIGKAQSGIGNISQVVLELQGQSEEKILPGVLEEFLRKFPLVNGLPARAINLCPYWKIFSQKKMLPSGINVTRLDDGADPFLLFESQLNEPFKDKREHLVFNFVSAGTRSFLSMVFDHRILDARGAEAFLDLFQRYYQKEALPKFVFEEAPHLDRWKEKFKAGQQVNRAFLDFMKNTPRTLPTPLRARECKFKTVHLDAVRAGRFVDAAYGQAGYLMQMPYALAKSVEIMHRVFEARNIIGATYLIPVSIDARTQEAVHKQLFFNHVSFFFFKIEADIVKRFPLLLARIKEQMYEQVKSGLPLAFKNATFLLRIAPLPLTNLFLQCMSKRKVASFSFSFVGTAYNAQKFMDMEVKNIFHLPRVPNPPGVGIFFNQFNGRMNAALSYFDGVLSDNEARQIVTGLEAMGNDG